METNIITYRGKQYQSNRADTFDLQHGDEYLFKEDGGDWVKSKIDQYHQGGIGVTLLEGNREGKFWYLFPDRLLCKF